MRDDWGNPGPLDAWRGLMACQDDNSFYAAVKGFAPYVPGVQQHFEENCKQLFGGVPIRLMNLSQETAEWYNTTGCYGALAGPQCVVQGMAGVPLNPGLTQFQLYCLNDCMDPYTVQSGEWEQAGDAVRQTYKDLWAKFLEEYPPTGTAFPTPGSGGAAASPK